MYLIKNCLYLSSNLGIVYQLMGEFDAALKLHQAHLTIARQLSDRGGMGRAYGNMVKHIT